MVIAFGFVPKANAVWNRECVFTNALEYFVDKILTNITTRKMRTTVNNPAWQVCPLYEDDDNVFTETRSSLIRRFPSGGQRHQ
ncbi:uncharacterized protein LOC143225270 isoform X5 [Tachypleus tridentatus]|uniref:uncharacterized protein LOC143225270 isoform X5 n=1 Tax=Tachypleus tridentatus TaxID=6853 RepID=UPI003FCF60FE